jgi:hypothetical protein
MHHMETIRGSLTRKIPFLPFLLLLGLVAGCAGAKVQSQVPDDYVEVQNPAQTMSPGSPETIWVPRSSVESGVPRGGVLVKRGYDAAKESMGTHPQAVTGGSPVTPPQAVMGGAPVTPPQAGISAPGGKPAVIVPRFGLVVALDGEKVFFNLGRDSGITPSQKLKVYRGGTVIEGLGLAPGELVATIEVQGFVGTNGGYGLVKQGGPLRINDLVGAE